MTQQCEAGRSVLPRGHYCFIVNNETIVPSTHHSKRKHKEGSGTFRRRASLACEALIHVQIVCVQDASLSMLST